MNKPVNLLQKSTPLLVCSAMVIAPALLGSYYGAWRWPAIYIVTLSAICSCFLYFFQRNPTSSRKKTPLHWLPYIPITLISLQGCWMWFNSWGRFARDFDIQGIHIPWTIFKLAEQPFPELFGAVDRAEAWDRLSYIIPCLLLILTVRYLVARRYLPLRQLCASIFWSGVIISSLGLIQRHTGADAILWCDTLFEKGRELFFGTYRSPGIATAYLNICLALGLSHLLSTIQSLVKKNTSKPVMPVLIGIGVLVLLTGSITAGSKAGMALAILTVVLWFTLNARATIHAIRNSSSLLPSRSPHERNLILTAALAAVALSLLSLGETVSTRWESAYKHDFSTLTHRQAANAVQIGMLSDPKWGAMGYGPGAFYPLFPYYTGTYKDELKTAWVYAHNDYLQTLIEWGWLGTGSFLILIAGGGFVLTREIFINKKRHRTSSRLYFCGISIAMIICLLHASIDFPFQIESIAFTFSALLGTAWATPRLRVRKQRTARE